MKHLLLIIFTTLIAVPVTAERFSLPVSLMCDSNPMELIELSQQYQELPLFVGTSLNLIGEQQIFGDMVFAVNQDTGSWSLIAFYASGDACLVSAGTEFEPYTN